MPRSSNIVLVLVKQILSALVTKFTENQLKQAAIHLPVTETLSSADALLSTAIWNLAIWLTGISSRLFRFTNTRLELDTEQTKGQPKNK